MALAKYVRPQRHRSWFNIIPERDFPNLKSSRVPFLDTFVTIEKVDEEPGYAVQYQGREPMIVQRHFGFICVWFGYDLQRPEWEFPDLFESTYGKPFVISPPRVFRDTNLLDLIENNGDQLHFKTVHRWMKVKIWNHDYSPDAFRLKMAGTIKYGRNASNPLKRWASDFFPQTSYSQDLAFHGPGFGAGKITTSVGLDALLVLAFTPVGKHDLKLHLAASIDEKMLPGPARKLFDANPWTSFHDFVASSLTRYGVQDTDGDYRIWKTKRSLAEPRLLKGEDDIVNIRNWMSQYYFDDFEQPEQPVRTDAEKSWLPMAAQHVITKGKTHPFKVGGEELVAYQTSNGEVRVFEAHCPHQGAHLGYDGRVKDDCIGCPFHHFYFNADGKFVGSKPGGKAKPQMELTAVPHRISEGVIEVRV